MVEDGKLRRRVPQKQGLKPDTQKKRIVIKFYFEGEFHKNKD